MANYKPALFNSEMVQALLEGRKTETRRVIKPQPAAKLYWTLNESCWPGYFSNSEEQRVYKPPFRPGDIIWVRETYRVDYLSNIIGTGRIQYKADGQYADICFDSARYTGAWIEVHLQSLSHTPLGVAPYAGAWIEVLVTRWQKCWIKSLPARERGLKPILVSLH